MHNRRQFLKTALAAATLLKAVPAVRPSDSFSLEEITIAELRKRLDSHSISSLELVKAYQERIRALDPKLKSVIELNPDAEQIAAECDRKRREGRTTGILDGIPLLIKDNIATADRMETTAGSLALVGARPAQDAFLVRRLRASGAVILGKTNLSEWANFRSTRSTSGWSARGGQCRNPYDLSRSPSGSSSGSAAAVAANLCVAAIGTETDGSIVSPSGTCGIVGIKPTLGLVSRSGIIPIAHSQDTAGPMCRSVADAAALLGVLTGIDPEDVATSQQVVQDYTSYLQKGALKGARIGIARNYFGFNDRVDRLLQEAILALKEGGAVIVDPVALPVHRLSEPEYTVLLYEFKAGLNSYLQALPQSPVRNLKSLIEFNEKHSEELVHFGQEIFLAAEAKGPLTNAEYRKALAQCRLYARKLGIDALMAKHRLDAICAPTNGPAWPIDYANGDHYTGGCSTAAAVAGYPHVTVPAGYVYGLPVGLSFFAGSWSEARLIGYAYAFEQIVQARRAPATHTQLQASTLNIPLLERL